jgi:uncharacterized PurR-regulated membrane protein YhhQ (DUF165 family)
MICVASVVAFASALIIDTVIYQRLFKKSKTIKMNGSNIGSALIDSILFPTIAFGIFMPWIILGQFLAKILGGVIWVAWLTRCKHEWESPYWDWECKKCGKIKSGVYR